jgi:hypothetical protein
MPRRGMVQARQALDEGQVKQALLMLQGELGLTPRNPNCTTGWPWPRQRLGDTRTRRRTWNWPPNTAAAGAAHAALRRQARAAERAAAAART